MAIAAAGARGDAKKPRNNGYEVDRQFAWPGFSLLDRARIDVERLLSHTQVTDSDLLARAGRHEARLATFDRRLVVGAVPRGDEIFYVI